LAHLISRTWTAHITIDLAIAFKKMAQAILNSRTTTPDGGGSPVLSARLALTVRRWIAWPCATAA